MTTTKQHIADKRELAAVLDHLRHELARAYGHKGLRRGEDVEEIWALLERAYALAVEHGGGR